MKVLVLVLCILQAVWSQNPYPPTEELEECTRLIWEDDTNSFPDAEIQYNLTGTQLFVSVNEERFQTGAYPSFRNLLNKFNPNIGQPDPDLDVDIETFLDAVLATGPMQRAYECLSNPSWGHVTDEADFRLQVWQYWFLKYSRSDGAHDDSSGFEYVFQGQISEDGSAVTGFHGWVHTYDSEQAGNFTYGTSAGDCQDGLVQINNFQYQDASKSLSSIWIGTSPEVQLALYTTCFLTRRNQNCNIVIDIEGAPKTFTVVSRDMEINGQDTIDVLYPECENGDVTPDPTGTPGTTVPGSDISTCTEAIWANDTNSFADDEIVYNLEGPILFTSVNESRFETGTYPTFRDLLNKYNPQLGEDDLPLETEIDAFLDAVMITRPMQTALGCMIGWGEVSDEAEFRALVFTYWFEKYSRSGGEALDSSGFEHVFQGEIRENGNEMTGWHGWVYTYDTEQSEEFVYGYSGDDCGDNLIQMNDYTFRGANKPISSIWIGKSPELQLALYTMCFARDRNGNCDFTVDRGRPETVVNFDLSGTEQIGTAYPFC